MNNSIIIFCTALTTCSLAAFGYFNWNQSKADHEPIISEKTVGCASVIFNPFYQQSDIDLGYNIDSRFMTTISKEELHQANSILDIVPEEANWSEKSFEAVAVGVLHGDDDIRASGDNKALNPAQTKLLQSTDYSTNFYIKASGENNYTGQIENYAYYLTIIPEQEATYSDGPDALITHLKKNSKVKTGHIRQDQLEPGRINFTVTKSGTIENVILDSSSGYSSIDEALIELVSEIPGEWQPAKNSKGEEVDQMLVLFFGRQGC